MNTIPLKNKDAFTMLEILIAVAIIAILVVMMVPSMTLSYRKNYYDDACKNLRSIQAAQQVYKENTGSYFCSDNVNHCSTVPSDAAYFINTVLGIPLASSGGTKYYCCQTTSNDCRAYLKSLPIKLSATGQPGEITIDTCQSNY